MPSRLFTIQWTLFLFAAVFSRAVPAADWPQFHGPNRDNKSADTGLLKAWPEGGPPRLWETSGIGQGYSSVAIAVGRVYVTGEIDGDCVLTAFGLNGNKLWTRTNGAAWSGSYPGTRSTPTITDDGLLYHLSGIGSLVCLKADTGQRVWSVNILEKFAGRNITWGLAESPLVVDDLVICMPGGKEISMVALDRHSGRAVWKCNGAGDKPGYASPILVEYHGLRQIITAMSESYVAVRAYDSGIRHVLQDNRVDMLAVGMRFPTEIDTNVKTLAGDTTYTNDDRALLAGVSAAILNDEKIKQMEVE